MSGAMLMKEENNNTNFNFILPLLPLLSIAVVAIFAILKKQDSIHIIKSIVIIFLLTSTITFYINMENNRHIMKEKQSKMFFSVIYLSTICLVMQPYSPETFVFWLLGPLLIAMIQDSRLAFMISLNMTILLSINSSLRPEQTIHLLIVGLLMVLLSDYLKEKSSLIYGTIIVLSANIILAFVINNFIFDYTYSYVKSLMSLFLVLALAYLTYKIYDNKTTKEDIIYKNEIVNDDLQPSTYIREDKTSYEMLLDENNLLWKKIKEHSKSLYDHSKLVGELSEKAANTIGADSILCKAGGRFHELGKINNGNYMEEGLRLAKDHSFPQKLKDILREHNIKHDKPTSVESAIVMLTDHLVSTLYYISKTKDNKYSTDKIIEQLFQIRLNKGSFDKSGLLVEDYNGLKEFFIEEFKKD